MAGDKRPGECAGLALVQSLNPIHDTGGSKRSAQFARQLLRRGWQVLFVSDGTVTESESPPWPDLDPMPVVATSSCCRARLRALERELPSSRRLVISQVASRRWLREVRRLCRRGYRHVYDINDDYTGALGHPWFRPENVAKMAALSAVITATAPGLVSGVASRTGQSVALLPNAVDPERFCPGSYSRPEDLPAGRPIAMYAGSFWGDWFDRALMEVLARENPAVPFVLIGEAAGHVNGLPENCHLLGLKSQAELPAYLAHVDVCFIPRTVNAVTETISPLKVYEHMAMGVPTVAPATEPLQGLPGVDCAATPQQFCAMLRARLVQPAGEAERAAMLAFAADNTWAHRIDRILAWTNLA